MFRNKITENKILLCYRALIRYLSSCTIVNLYPEYIDVLLELYCV